MGKTRMNFNQKSDAATTIRAEDPAKLLQAPIEELGALVEANGAKVAQMGQWPAHIAVSASLTGRVPFGDNLRSGFDAGVACSLGLMPPHSQKLIATLHAAYTPEAVAEIRRETNNGTGLRHADSAVCWWLAGCSVCIEGDTVDEKTFRAQLHEFQALMQDPEARLLAAHTTLQEMVGSFDTKRGYAFGTQDGSMQGAYIAGHDVAVMHAPTRDLYFIGTFHETLGLENFNWDSKTDDRGRATSGPVHGSRQFVKCASAPELDRIITALKKGPLLQTRTVHRDAPAKPLK